MIFLWVGKCKVDENDATPKNKINIVLGTGVLKP
jgi:hypothetical protein